MTDVKNWSETAAENNQVAPDGWEEGMKRSDVNNSARENMRAIRKDYAAGEWLSVYSTTGDAWLASWAADTVIGLIPQDGQVTEFIGGRFPDGSRLKIVTDTPSTQYAFVVSTALLINGTLIVIAVDDGAALDNGTNMTVEVGMVRDLLEKTAYYPTGSTTGQTPPQVPTIDDLGDQATLNGGHDPEGDGSDGINADMVDGKHYAEIIADASGATSRGAVYNAEFMVWQRGTSINSTATLDRQNLNSNGLYTADRWKLLSGAGATPEDNLVTVDRETSSVPTGYWSCALLTAQGGVGANDFAGLLQILEGKESAQFIDSTSVSLSAHMKGTGSLGKVRAMVLGWDGTEDAPTADPILNWGTPGDAGGPTFVTDWNKLADSGQTTIDGTWARYEFEDLDISAISGVKNIGIFFYIDDEAWTSGDTWSVTGIQLENGNASSAFIHRDFDIELSRCQRYYANTVDEGEDPRTQLGEHTGFQMWVGQSPGGNDDSLAASWEFPRTMRTVPSSLRIYNTVNDTADTWYEQRLDTDEAQANIDETLTTKRVNFSLENTLESRVFRAHLEVSAEF
jgi:hypothetical protein